MKIGSIFVIEGQERKILLPCDFKITGNVKGSLIDLFIQQTYMNNDDSPTTFNYLYPSENNCLYGITFFIEDQKIELKIDEKDSAESAFIEATSHGQTAVVTRMLPQGLSEFVIGTVPPQTQFRIEFHLACVLKIHDNEIFFNIPISLYSPDDENSAKISLADKPLNFSLNLQLDIKDISDVTLSGIEGTYNSDTHTIECNKLIPNSKPLIHIFTTNPISTGAVISKDSEYLAITAVHSSASFPTTSKINSDYIVIVDCSGSMDGSRILAVRQCLNCFIRSLPHDCSFDIIRFGSKAISLFNGLEKINEKSLLAATQLANDLKADLGRTQILNALQLAFANPIQSGRILQLFLLTDGEVDDRDKTLAYMSNKRNISRIFSLGIGEDADISFLKKMSKETNGECDYIIGPLDTSKKVIRLLKTSRVSGVFDLSLSISDDSNEFQAEVVPFPLPILFAHSSQTFFVKTNKKMNNHNDENSNKNINETETVPNILISGKMENDFDFIVDPSNIIRVDDSKFLKALFSYQGINDYQNEIEGLIINRDNPKAQEQIDLIKKKIIQLSIESGILSKYTAFIGVAGIKVQRTNKYRGMCFCVPPPDYYQTVSCQPFHRPKQLKDDQTKPPIFDMNQLISLQLFNGSWKDLQQIQSISGLEFLQKLEKPNLQINNANESVYATIYALAILRKLASDWKDAWELLAENAMEYLRTISTSTDWDAIINPLTETF